MANLLPTDALATWSTVSSNPDYKSAPDEAKTQAVNEFFDKNIAPTIPKDKLTEAHKQWAFSVVPAQEFYTNPDFLKLEDKDKAAVFRNNLIANGAPADKVDNSNYSSQPAGFASGDFAVPTATSPSLVDQAYQKWATDPNVSILRKEALSKSIGAPIAALQQTVGAIKGDAGNDTISNAAQATGGPIGQIISGLAAKNSLTNANRFINRKNELQSYFPQTIPAEVAASAGPALAGGELIAGATKLPEGAGLLARASRGIANAVGNAGIGTAINPEQISAGGDQQSKTLAAKSSTAATNAAITAGASTLIPAWMGGKRIIAGFTDAASGLTNRINTAAEQLAKFAGISKEQALTNLAKDQAAANQAESTIAGITGVNSSTAPNSTTLAQNVVKPQSNLAVQSDVRTNQINAQAQKAIETAGTNVAAQKAAAAPLLPAKNLPEGTSLPAAQAQLALNKLASAKFAQSDPMARATVVGTAADVAKNIDVAVYPNSKLPITDSEGLKALANSPTVQAIKADAGAVTPASVQTLSPEYAATVKAQGQGMADAAVNAGQIQKFAPQTTTLAPKTMTAETLQDHIDNIGDEINDATGTKQKAALMGVKQQLLSNQAAVYKANPGLEQAVGKSMAAARTDKSLQWFENNVPELDQTNTMGTSGKLKNTLTISNPKAFLEANDNSAAAKDRASLMRDNPTLLKAANDLIDAVRLQARQEAVSIRTGVTQGSAEEAGGKAVLKQILPLRAGALNSVLEATKKAVNSEYGKALENFAGGGAQAGKSIQNTILKNKSEADFKTLYQNTIRPTINAGSTVISNDISNSTDSKNIQSSAVPVVSTETGATAASSIPIATPAAQVPTISPNWLNFSPSH